MIQIDIDLPETCSDCPMKEIQYKEYYCGLISDFVRGRDRYFERDSRCPLREVKKEDCSKCSYADFVAMECDYFKEGEEDG